MTQKINCTGTFLVNNVQVELLFVFMNENNILTVEYINCETGEIFSNFVRNMDDDIAIIICKQFEEKTGIDCDYRNI